MPYRVLIASASAGAGHVRAAAALCRAFQLAGLAGSAQTIDALQYTNSIFRRVYLRSYLSVIRALPWYWRHLYRRWDKVRVGGFERQAMFLLDRLNAGKFVEFVRDFEASHVICTHFLPAEILAWMRRTGRLRVPLAVVVTDYDAHRMWMNEGTDLYFVASDNLRGAFISKGAPADRVVTSGIPIDPAFAEPRDRAAARRELALDPDRPTILAVSGSMGYGGIDETVLALAACGQVQILAVAGRNVRAKERLDRLALPPDARLAAFGFVDNIEVLMAASELIVTKPGGLSSTECLAAGLPMVLTMPIPGQEEKNSAFLVGCGAALPARDADELRRVVSELLAHPARLERMREAALRAARPRAAFDIVNATVALPPG